MNETTMLEFTPILPSQASMEFVAYSRELERMILEQFRVPSDLMSMTVTSKRKVWRGPSDRFVEYDDRDEEWMRYFGLGREVEETDTMHLQSCYIDSCERGVTRIVALSSDF